MLCVNVLLKALHSCPGDSLFISTAMGCSCSLATFTSYEASGAFSSSSRLIYFVLFSLSIFSVEISLTRIPVFTLMNSSLSFARALTVAFFFLLSLKIYTFLSLRFSMALIWLASTSDIFFISSSKATFASFWFLFLASIICLSLKILSSNQLLVSVSVNFSLITYARSSVASAMSSMSS